MESKVSETYGLSHPQSAGDIHVVQNTEDLSQEHSVMLA
jgi:hypothetical protein